MSNPTTAVFPLQSDLTGTGQSGALALTGVDPIRYDGGLLLEEATTNYVYNPIGGVDTTGWFPASNVTIIRETTLPGPLPGWLASAVTTGFKLTTAATKTAETALAVGTTNVPSAEQYVTLGYFWIPSAVTATSLEITVINMVGATVVASALDMLLRDQWQEVIGSVSPVGGDLNGHWGINLKTGSMQTGENLWWTCAGAQPEDYATTPAIGSLGAGYDFTGTDHYSPSTRAASSASISPSDILDPATGSLAFRLTRKIDTGAEELYGECGQKASGKDHLRWGVDASDHPFVEWSSNNAAYQRITATETVDAETEYFFYFGYNGTDTYLQVDSGTPQTGTRDVVEDDFSVGDLTLEASAGGVIVSPFATFDRPLTDTEIATLAARQGWSMSTLDSTTRRIRAQFELRPAY